MSIDLIKRIQPINRISRAKHSTEDPNERRRRQLLLTYGYKSSTTNHTQPFGQVIKDVVEISEEGKRAAGIRYQ